MYNSLLIRLYLFSLPIVNAFNFSTTLIIPILISTLMLLNLLAHKKIKIYTISKIILFFLFIVIISVVLNIHSIEKKNINHLVAFFSVLILYVVVPIQYINKIRLNQILKIFFISFILTSFFAFFEFLDKNFFHWEIIEKIPRPSVTEYNPTFFAFFVRSRSFFEESGHYASYLLVIFPFIYLYLKNKNLLYKLLFIILFIINSACVFSTALFIFFPSIIILFVIKNFLLSPINKKIAYIILIFMVLSSSIFFFEELSNFVHILIFSKIESISFYDRYTKFLQNLDFIAGSSILQIIFGHGPGSYININISASITMYINILRDIGLIGFITLLCIFVYSFIYIHSNIKNMYKNFFYFSLISIILFYLSIGNYFYPHFWFPFVLMYHKEVRK